MNRRFSCVLQAGLGAYGWVLCLEKAAAHRVVSDLIALRVFAHEPGVTMLNGDFVWIRELKEDWACREKCHKRGLLGVT